VRRSVDLNARSSIRRRNAAGTLQRVVTKDDLWSPAPAEHRHLTLQMMDTRKTLRSFTSNLKARLHPVADAVMQRR
jgi:hypothetical protein